MGWYPYWKCRTLDDRMPYPHYSDPTWDTYRLVYGDEDTKCDGSADSDRLWEWDYARAEAAWASVPEAQRNTPRGVQTYLSAYHNRPVDLVSIHAITNRSNGYTVWSYAWKWAEVTP